MSAGTTGKARPGVGHEPSDWGDPWGSGLEGSTEGSSEVLVCPYAQVVWIHQTTLLCFLLKILHFIKKL